jgi:hypothetical protein
MSIQRRLHGHETDSFVREAKRAFADRLRGAAATGPFTLIFHGVVDADQRRPSFCAATSAVALCQKESREMSPPFETTSTIRSRKGNGFSVRSLAELLW